MTTVTSSDWSRALDTRLQSTATITADTTHSQAGIHRIFETFRHPAYLQYNLYLHKLHIDPLQMDTAGVTFTTHASYLGLPQLRAFYDLQLHLRLRTSEASGLIMFNAGKETSAANRLIGEVVQSRRRPLLGPSPG